MIVKLKCVDTCGVKYITEGKIYEAEELAGYDRVYDLECDEGELISVSTDNRHNNIHGKWEAVSE